MAANARSRRVWQWFTSVRTGIVLLIAVGLAVLAGTLILQRPINEPTKLHQVYSPEVLRWLDKLNLTDVFHSWWFITLLALFAANIIVVSLDRFPAAWRYYSRPYRSAEPYFLRSLRNQRRIRVEDAAEGIERAELAFRRMGLRPEYMSDDRGSVSLYAERHRIARMAPFIVHTSLLLILAGGIIDAVCGFKGYISLTKGDAANQFELSDGRHKNLGFSLRCDGAGQENYADGSPKRWWSKLAVIEGGEEVLQKEIAVNDPLTYGGVRFYQSGYGPTGDVTGVKLEAAPKSGSAAPLSIIVRQNEPAQLDPDTTVSLAQFIPDFVLVDNQIQKRSDEPVNPAIQLSITSSKTGESKTWVFPNYPQFRRGDSPAYTFNVQDLEQGYFTGLQVSHEPGQWAVWAGVLLMAVSLALTFYFVHTRYWAVITRDDEGRPLLWIGAQANKNREDFDQRFGRLADLIQGETRKQGRATRIRSAELAAAK
jgi:cytochrome c biogenesis protein